MNYVKAIIATILLITGLSQAAAAVDPVMTHTHGLTTPTDGSINCIPCAACATGGDIIKH